MGREIEKFGYCIVRLTLADDCAEPSQPLSLQGLTDGNGELCLMCLIVN